MKDIAGLSESFATYPLPFRTTEPQQDDTRNNHLKNRPNYQGTLVYLLISVKDSLLFGLTGKSRFS
ncbi:MAG: hypothetical protein ACK5KP_09335 [Paludibacteraceae bacterium]